MELDIQTILQKVQAKLGELELQLIIAKATIEELQDKLGQVAAGEGEPDNL